MIVVGRLTERNTFGGFTYQFKIGNYMKVKIHEANGRGYLFELFEPNWVYYKKIDSFMSNLRLEEAVTEGFANIYAALLTRKEFYYPIDIMIEDRNEVLYQIKRLSDVNY